MNGLQIKYAELFSLSVEQLFYMNKICRKYKAAPDLDLTILPTAECMDVMKRMDLVFRNTDTIGGFIVLARVLGKTDAGDDILRFPAQPGDKLTFNITLRNPDVINFNALPSQRDISKLFYFANTAGDAGAIRNALTLTNDPSGVKVTDQVKVTDENYRFHNSVTVNPSQVKVKHLLTGIEIFSTFIVNQGGVADINFNLLPLPSGMCQLSINGIISDEFYYTGNTPPAKPFGIIELSLDSGIMANYRIIESDRSLTKVRPLFLITFVNRMTFWRYNLHLQPNSPLYLEMAALNPADKTDFLNRLNIESNDIAITFNKVSASDTDISFVSVSTLGLQENYFSSPGMTHALSLTLKKYIGLPGKVAAVKTDLPYPSTGSINASADPLIYSDIFLTL